MSKKKKKHKKQPAPAAEQPRPAPALAAGSPVAAPRAAWGWLALVIIAALLARGVVLYQVETADPFVNDLLPDGDEHSFLLWAEHIAAGDVLGASGNYIQAPLYPYVMALVFKVCGAELLAVRVLQVLLDSLAAGLVFLVAARFFARPVAVLAGLLYAGNVVPAFFATRILRDSPMPFLIMLALYAVVRAADAGNQWRPWLAAGMAAGLAHLCRENFMLITVAIVAWILTVRRYRRAWRSVLVPFLAGLLILFTPVGIRNVAVGADVFTITQNGQVALIMGNAADASGVGYVVPDSADRIAARATGLWGTLRATLATHRDAPFGLVTLYLRKLHALFNHLKIANNTNFYVAQDYSSLLAWPLPDFGLIAPLAVLGLFLTVSRTARPSLYILHLFVVTYAGTLLLFFILERFRYPLLPVLSIFAAAFVYRVWCWSRCRRWEIVFLAVIALVPLYAVVYTSTPYEEEHGDLAYREYYVRGKQLLDSGQPAAGRAWVERALAAKPDFAQALNTLAIQVYADGDTAASLLMLKRATEAMPTFLEAWVNLANIAFAARDYSLAGFSYFSAVQLQPGNLQLRHDLANVLLLLERYPQAAQEYDAILQIDPNDAFARSQMEELRKAFERGELSVARETVTGATAGGRARDTE